MSPASLLNGALATVNQFPDRSFRTSARIPFPTVPSLMIQRLFLEFRAATNGFNHRRITMSLFPNCQTPTGWDRSYRIIAFTFLLETIYLTGRPHIFLLGFFHAYGLWQYRAESLRHRFLLWRFHDFLVTVSPVTESNDTSRAWFVYFHLSIPN